MESTDRVQTRSSHIIAIMSMRARGRLCVRCGCKQAYWILDVCFLGYRWWWGRALTIVFVLVCLYIAHAFLGPVIACIEDSYHNVFYIVCAGLLQATVWVDWRVCNERVHVGACDRQKQNKNWSSRSPFDTLTSARCKFFSKLKVHDIPEAQLYRNSCNNQNIQSEFRHKQF